MSVSLSPTRALRSLAAVLLAGGTALVVAQELENYVFRVPVQAAVHVPQTFSHDFGNVAVGAPVSRVLTFVNRSTEETQVQSVATQGKPLVISSSTCEVGARLAPGAICQMTATLRPEALGRWDASVSVAHSAARAPDIFELRAFGVDDSVVLRFDQSWVQFDPLPIQQVSAPKTLTLQNHGTEPAEIAAVALSGATTVFRFEDNQCETTLLPGERCTLSVVFAPRMLGAYNAQLTIKLATGERLTGATLYGRGVQGSPSWSTSTVNFTGVLVGELSPAQTLTLSNSGSGELLLDKFELSGDTSFSMESSTCGASLSPGQSCALKLRLLAPDTDVRSATLTLTSSQSSLRVSRVQLFSQPVAAESRLVWSPTALDFGLVPVGQSAELELTMTSQGNQALSVSALELSSAAGANFSVVNPENCIGSLAPGMRCTIRVRATPQTAGALQAQLQPAGQTTEPIAPVSLNVTGAQGRLSATPVLVSFDNARVGESRTAVVQVSNAGDAPIQVHSVAVSPSLGSGLQASGCSGQTLAPAQTCSLTLTSAPSVEGAFSGTVDVMPPAGQASARITINGRAGAAAVAGAELTVMTCTPQPVETLQPADCVATLRSTGELPLSVGALSRSNPLFMAPTSDCPASLAPGSSCTVQMRMVPTTAAEHTSSLTVQTGVGPKVTSARVEAQAPSASLSVNPHEVVLVGQANTRTHLVTNIGRFPVRLSALATSDNAVFSVVPDAAGPTCTASTVLDAGQACQVTTRCTPTSAGALSATLSQPSNAGTLTARLTCTGEHPPATGAQLEFSPNPVELGNSALNAAVSQTVTVTNRAPGSVTISQIALSGVEANQFAVLNNQCLRTLTSTQSCTFEVRGLPTSLGQKQAALSVQANTSSAVPSVPVRVTGVSGQLSAAPSPMDFGAVVQATRQTRTVVVRNVGQVSLRVDTVAIQGRNPTSFPVSSGGTCVNATLAPGATCQVNVAFVPATVGPLEAALVLTSANSVPASLSVPLQGEGLAPPVPAGALTLSPDCSAPVQYGQAAQCTVQLRSTGNTALSVSGYLLTRIQGDFVNSTASATNARAFSAIQGGTLNSVTGVLVLPPGATAQMVVKAYPYATGYVTSSVGPRAYQSTAGEHTNRLDITSNATQPLQITHALRINPLELQLEPRDPSLSLQPGEQRDFTLSVVNRGSAAVGVGAAPSFSATPYTSWFAPSAPTTCVQGASLGVGQTCTASWSCTPSAANLSSTATVTLPMTVPLQTVGGPLIYRPWPLSTTLRCVGVPATATVTPSYGTLTSSVSTGSLSGNWRRFTNTSRGPQTITALSAPTGLVLNADPAQSGHCVANKVLAPGAYCDFQEVVTHEQASPSPRLVTGTGTVRTNAGVWSWTADYRVLGVSLSADLPSTDTTIQRGGSRSFTVTLTNTAPSALSSIQWLPSAGLTVQSSTCATVAPGASCTVSLVAAPDPNNSTLASLQVSLDVRGRFERLVNGQAQPSVAQSLAGQWSRLWSVVEPVVAIEPPICSTCTSGTAPGAETEFELPITNNGSEPIVFDQPATIEGDGGEYTIYTTTCQIALAAGRSCKKKIKFKPVVGKWGWRTATLVVPYRGGSWRIPLRAYAMPRTYISMSTRSSMPTPYIGNATTYDTDVANNSPDGAPAVLMVGWNDTVTSLSTQAPSVTYDRPTCSVTGAGSTCSVVGNQVVFRLVPGGTGRLSQRVNYGIIPCRHDRSFTASLNGSLTGTPDPSFNGSYDPNLSASANGARVNYVVTECPLVQDAQGARYWADGRMAASCQAYLAGDPAHSYSGPTGSGSYWIDADGAGPRPPRVVHCDMTTAGGGWTCPFSEVQSTPVSRWVSPVDDAGLVYNQVLLWAGSNHWMDYATPTNGAAWETQGFSIPQTVLQFGGTAYLSRSTPAGRGCGSDALGVVTIPGYSVGYLPDSAYNNLSPNNQCQLGSSNYPGQCSNHMTVTVPYAGARLSAIGDMESYTQSCTSDNQIRKEYSICFRQTSGAVPASASAPQGGIVMSGASRTWFDGKVATSCRAYRQGDGGAGHLYMGAIGDGFYRIDPDGTGPAQPTDAWCDMTSDNGLGYTLQARNAGTPLTAFEMEAQCASSGMQLFVPRSNAHFTAARTKYGTQHFALMGIYPKYRGATCMGTQFNSAGCASWGPLNGGSWFVQSGLNVSEPNGDNDVTGSMIYQYSGNAVSWYNDIYNSNAGGYKSAQFACSARDEGGLGVASVAHLTGTAPAATVYNIAPHPAWTTPAYGASWLWTDPAGASGNMGPRACFQAPLNNPTGAAMDVTLVGAADNSAVVQVNGATVGGYPTYQGSYSLSARVPPGRNLIRVEVSNGGGPAGLLMWVLDPSGRVLTTTHTHNGWTACP